MPYHSHDLLSSPRLERVTEEPPNSSSSTTNNKNSNHNLPPAPVPILEGGGESTSPEKEGGGVIIKTVESSTSRSVSGGSDTSQTKRHSNPLLGSPNLNQPLRVGVEESRFLENLDFNDDEVDSHESSSNNNIRNSDTRKMSTSSQQQPPLSPQVSSSRSSSTTSVSATTFTEPPSTRKQSTSTGSLKPAPRLSSSASAVGANSIAENNNNNDNSNNPLFIQAQSITKELWNKHSKLALNSKPSDPLTYARVRKEAFLLYNRANTPTRQMDLIELWTIMALRLVLKSSLLFSPVSNTVKKMGYGNSNTILDVHGAFKAPWGWQVAFDCPSAVVYGYEVDHTGGKLSSTAAGSSTNGGSGSGIGPPNYVPVMGDSLYSFPFEDDMFDVVSCKSLWYLLREEKWQDVLKEVYRVLKPGGAIELTVCDYDVLNKSAEDEYWFSRLVDGVKRKGIHPYPSVLAPTVLTQVGFNDINRARLALPRGWGGQIGQMTDFMSMYYTDAMFSYFADLTAEEVPLMKSAVTVSGPRPDTFCAATLILIYATKPI